MQFKHAVYRLGRQCLDTCQQKVLVEFFYMIEYSRDRHSFLNKYPQIETIMVRLLEYIEEEYFREGNEPPSHQAMGLLNQNTIDTKSTLKQKKISRKKHEEEQQYQHYRKRMDCPNSEAVTVRDNNTDSKNLGFSERLAQMRQQIEEAVLGDIAKEPVDHPQQAVRMPKKGRTGVQDAAQNADLTVEIQAHTHQPPFQSTKQSLGRA